MKRNNKKEALRWWNSLSQTKKAELEFKKYGLGDPFEDNSLSDEDIIQIYLDHSEKGMRLSKLKTALLEKLDEWAKTEHEAEILIDSFLEYMRTDGLTEDDRLNLLEQAIECSSGFVRDRLNYEATAIKVNYGY